MSSQGYSLSASALDSVTGLTGKGSGSFSVGPVIFAPGAGATVNGSTYNLSANQSVQAAQMFNQFAGARLALNLQRWYMTETESYASLPPGLAALLAAGCGIQLCVKPSRTVTTAAKTSLSKFLGLVSTALTAAGTPQSAVTVTLWTENDGSSWNTGNPGITFSAYWAAYQPVIAAAGFEVCYNPSCNLSSYATAISNYQSLTIKPDLFGVDWYGTPWSNSVFPDKTPSGMSTNLMALADGDSLPFCLLEWGTCSNGATPLTQTQWGQYTAYIQNLFTTRTRAGKKNGSIIYFGTAGTGTQGSGNEIDSSGDFRIPALVQLFNQFT